jgi:hypothetical protein
VVNCALGAAFKRDDCVFSPLFPIPINALFEECIAVSAVAL